jgi:hypothetical protein
VYCEEFLDATKYDDLPDIAPDEFKKYQDKLFGNK